MRKFKVKNRQKRKYTRKSVQNSSSPVSKTISVGLLPLFILAIALATTLIMSQAKGQNLTINYSLHIPQPKLPDIGAAIQEIPNLLTNPVDFVMHLFAITSVVIQQMVATIGYWFALLAHLLDPRPFVEVVARSFNVFAQTIMQFANVIENGIVSACTVILQAFITLGNIIADGIVVMLHAFVSSMIFIGGVIMHVLSFIGMILLTVIKAIINVITTIGVFIFVKVSAFINGVVYVIEIPFKILWSFWLQIKPFFDMLGAHIKMTGDDLNNGVNSINKVGELVKPSK